MFSVSFAAFKYCTFLYSYVGPGIVYFSYLECFCNVLFLFFLFTSPSTGRIKEQI